MSCEEGWVDDRLTNYFAAELAVYGDLPTSDMMALAFLRGLRVTQIHPEWARAILYKLDVELGAIGEGVDERLKEWARGCDHKEADGIVAAVPIALSAGPDEAPA